MIRIYADRRGERCRFFATGHAEGSAERDVVCAGVSALAGALVLHAVAVPCRHLRYSMAPGEVFLSCNGLGEGLDLVLRGLEAIAERYPHQVRIEQLTTK
ncbi:MAG: ribosomal-processing cysteine protease Prp [Clostridia bacterium]|nr:ribosomal-processing cysteine protease Prp [Clostridia bacterium]